MAPSEKGCPTPVPRVLRSESRDGLPLSQLSQQPKAQPPSRAPDTSSRSSRSLSPIFPNFISRSTPRNIDFRLVYGPASQPQPHQDSSRASSRIQSRTSSRAQTGSSRPPPQDISLLRPRDLIPRPRPKAIPHLMPRSRRTPIDRDLILSPGQGQFQIQLQAQPPPRIDPQPHDQNQEFYSNFPYPIPIENSPFPQSQMTNALGDRHLHQHLHRDLHQPQFPIQVHSKTQNRDQHFYNNFPYPFPTTDSPFSQFHMANELGDRDLHRGHHRYLVQVPAPVQVQNEIENETSTRASKRPRLSYSHSHPIGSRDEERNGDENRNRNENGTSNEIGTEIGTQNATQNEQYNPNDTSSESPLSTPPDSVSTSPPLPLLRNFPRRGTFSHSQRFDRSPTSRDRTRGGHGTGNQNGNGNLTASITGTTTPPSFNSLSNPYIEPPVLPRTLDNINRPTVAQKKWMYAVRKEGRRSDRNENGGYERGIEGQMVQLFGGGGEGGV